MSHNKTPSVISNARKHLSYFSVSKSNPSSFVLRVTKTEEKNASTEPTTWFRSIAVLPYVKGLSEQLCRFLQHQDISAVFNSETTLRSHLIRPKDTVDPAKQGAERLTLAKLADLCRRELRNKTGISDPLRLGSPPSQSTPTTPLERSKVYWPWSPFLHTRCKRGNSDKTSP